MSKCLVLLLVLGLYCVQSALSQGLCVENPYEDDESQFIVCVNRPSTVQVDQNTTLEIWLEYRFMDPDNVTVDNVTLDIQYEHAHVVDGPGNVTMDTLSNKTILQLYGASAGRTVLYFACPNGSTNATCPLTKEYLDLVEREVSIANSLPLNIFIDIVGWIYFLAWSISFYPQIFLNFKRRSVVGLNFDFLALNITGFLCYAAFNVGLFWITSVQHEYFIRHPAGVNPVLINDVVFALHAVAATAFTIFQCFIFERGGQRVSYSTLLILVAMWLTIFITLFVSVGGKLAWLDYLYALSYIKLAVTLIKYVPQAWLNCKRRSTEGWSIGNVLLDFTGGTFSIFQMFLLSYNYDDWNSIFGDPTKFGLGAFSIVFDILFMCQHYVIFPERKRKKAGYKKIEAADDEEEPLLKDEVDKSIDPTERIVNEQPHRKRFLHCFA